MHVQLQGILRCMLRAVLCCAVPCWTRWGPAQRTTDQSARQRMLAQLQIAELRAHALLHTAHAGMYSLLIQHVQASNAHAQYDRLQNAICLQVEAIVSAHLAERTSLP